MGPEGFVVGNMVTPGVILEKKYSCRFTVTR